MWSWNLQQFILIHLQVYFLIIYKGFYRLQSFKEKDQQKRLEKGRRDFLIGGREWEV